MKFLCSLLFCFFNVSAYGADRIKFGISTSNAPPLLYQFENQNMPIATGGFIYEITVAIAEELQDDYSIVTIPRGRIPQELTSGNLDLLCHSSTIWNLPYKKDVHWSKPLYRYSNVLVGREPIPWTQGSQVSNITIGTVLNFHYADLEDKFKKQKIFRDDAPSVAANVSKLLGERIDYVVMSAIEYSYYKKLYPKLHRSSFSEDTTQIQCTLSKKSTLTLKKLNKTIDRLTKKKTLQKIYERYTSAEGLPQPVTYGLNNNDSPPFIFFDKKAESMIVQGGVFFDLGLAVGKQIHQPINFILLPRVRLDAELAEGRIDLVCFDTEIWAGKYAKNYNWSQPIFKQINYIVYLKSLSSEPEPNTLNDLKGSTIGTTLHFVYPSIDSYFKNGTFRREDADSGLANLTKLNHGRVKYIILNNLEYGYYKKSNPRLEKLPVDIDPIDVKCAVSKRSDLKIEAINKAITEMKKSGALQKVFVL